MASPSTRAHIIETADRLFYEGGYEHTSFADIAKAVGISRGNFYYHFKTKDEILDAVISRRLSSTDAILTRWQAEGESPEARIRQFIHILITNQTKIMAHGCPVGSLCMELTRLGHPAQSRATTLFTLFRVWLARQFSEAGAGERADGLAMHLLARSQGVAVLASSLHDDAFIHQEVALMNSWLTEQITT